MDQWMLTIRQVEILELVAEGKTNVEIGVALNIGRETVKSALRAIYKKMKVHTRTEAAITYLRNVGRVHGKAR